MEVDANPGGEGVAGISSRTRWAGGGNCVGGGVVVVVERSIVMEIERIMRIGERKEEMEGRYDSTREGRGG